MYYATPYIKLYFIIMNHIELFAGCGGLGVGMKSAGFNLVLANEISPMASETFSYNLLQDDLTTKKTIILFG